MIITVVAALVSSCHDHAAGTANACTDRELVPSLMSSIVTVYGAIGQKYIHCIYFLQHDTKIPWLLEKFLFLIIIVVIV